MAQTLDKQLHSLIDNLNDKQKKAVLGIVKAFAEGEPANDQWKEEKFVAEMDRRYNDYKSGNAKLVSLDDVEKKAKAIAEKIKSKKAS